MNWRNNACKAKSSWSFHVCWQMIFQFSAHQKRGIGYCLPAFRGHVQQEALSLLPRISKKTPRSSTKLSGEVWHNSSRAKAVTWHMVSLPSHRWEIAALIGRFLLLVPYGPQLLWGVMKRVLCPERASDVLGHTGSQVWASFSSFWV